MNNKKIIEEFLYNFEIIKKHYYANEKKHPFCYQSIDEMGLHTFFGNFVEPYLVNMIEEENIKELKKLLCKIEEVLINYDDYAREAIEQSIFEGNHFGKNYDVLYEISPNKCKQILDKLQK